MQSDLHPRIESTGPLAEVQVICETREEIDMTRCVPLWSRNICRPMSSQAVQSLLPAQWPHRGGQR